VKIVSQNIPEKLPPLSLYRPACFEKISTF